MTADAPQPGRLNITIVATNPFEFDSRFLRSATSLAADRPLRPLLLTPTLALAVLYHQTNVLFVLPLLVLLAPGREDLAGVPV